MIAAPSRLRRPAGGRAADRAGHDGRVGAVILVEGIPLSVVAQRVVTGVQSFPLLAIPLFTLAGSLMNESGISERLFGFTRAFVGHIRGGLAQTAIVGNVFLSGISGSSVADCAATTRVFVPQLVKAGYGQSFARRPVRGLRHARSDHSAVDPDGHLRVAGQHLARRSLLGRHRPRPRDGARDDAADGVTSRARRHYPKDAAFSGQRLWVQFKHAFWALMMPVLILVRLPHGRVHRHRDRRRRRRVRADRRHVFLPHAALVADPADPAHHGQGDGGDPADRRGRGAVSAGSSASSRRRN